MNERQREFVLAQLLREWLTVRVAFLHMKFRNDACLEALVRRPHLCKIPHHSTRYTAHAPPRRDLYTRSTQMFVARSIHLQTTAAPGTAYF
jgi:hypothetical protein